MRPGLSVLMLPILLPVTLCAQEYIVSLQTRDGARLYIGYINEIRVLVSHPDTAHLFKTHVRPIGAEVDYTDDGKVRMLPFQRQCGLEVIVERGTHFYRVGRIQYEAIKPPPAYDETFIEVMGITKEDPKTKLTTTRKFDMTGKTLLNDPAFEIEGYSFMDIMPAKPTTITVARIFLKENEKYTPLSGRIELLSTEATIRKLSKKSFSIQSLPGKRRVRITVYLDGKKISVEEIRVRQPGE